MKSLVDERVMLRFQFQINIPNTCLDSPRRTSIFLVVNQIFETYWEFLQNLTNQ